MNNFPFYTASVFGLIIFSITILRISTKIILYIGIAITGYIVMLKISFTVNNLIYSYTYLKIID